MIMFTDRFSHELYSRGFRLDCEFDFSGSKRFQRIEYDRPQYVSWYGSRQYGGQVIVASGQIVDRWPIARPLIGASAYREARSPFFFVNKDMFNGGETDFGFLEKVCQWLDSAGLAWLADPCQRTDEHWANDGVFTGYCRRDFWGQLSNRSSV